MTEQNFKNHTRVDPLYHYAVMPVLLANLVVSIVRAFEQPGGYRFWLIAVALALLALAVRVRTYALEVQNRVILLQERLRMAALLPSEAGRLQGELTRAQVIALRFASDQELGPLAGLAAREKLTPKQIKERITVWRADDHRV